MAYCLYNLLVIKGAIQKCELQDDINGVSLKARASPPTMWSKVKTLESCGSQIIQVTIRMEQTHPAASALRGPCHTRNDLSKAELLAVEESEVFMRSRPDLLGSVDIRVTAHFKARQRERPSAFTGMVGHLHLTPTLSFSIIQREPPRVSLLLCIHEKHAH